MSSDPMVADLKTRIILPRNQWEGSVYGVDTGIKGKSHLHGKTDQESLRFYYTTHKSMQLQLVGCLFLEFNLKIADNAKHDIRRDSLFSLLINCGCASCPLITGTHAEEWLEWETNTLIRFCSPLGIEEDSELSEAEAHLAVENVTMLFVCC